MKAWIWLRVAAVLQALGTAFHTLATARGTASRGPREQAVFDAMQAFHFDLMGVSRSHWDFYRGLRVLHHRDLCGFGRADLAAE